MNSSPRGYPLGALFVLVTVCAVLVAGVAPLVRLIQDGNVETHVVLIAVGSGALCGIVVGMIVGLLQFRLGLGLVMGVGIGAIIGIAAGVMALLNSEQVFTAAAAMTAGSGLVVVVAVLMRRNS